MTESVHFSGDIPKVGEVLRDVTANGQPVECLLGWKGPHVMAFTFQTASEASYLVEPVVGEPTLVSRITEFGPRVDYDGPRTEYPLVRREGNPSREIKVGEPVIILGLSRSQTDRTFDPDSMYTTSPVTSITVLDASD